MKFADVINMSANFLSFNKVLLMSENYREIKSLKEAKNVIAEQDRLIGELNRKVNFLEDTSIKRAEWLSNAKKEAGYDNNQSFDIVWKETLKKAQSKDNYDLIKAHDDGTGYCSVMPHMRNVSPTYAQIMTKGQDILPDILIYLKNNNGGMNIMMLLWDILKTSPYQPEKLVEEFATFNVSKAKDAWIKWGQDKKLI